MKGFKIISLAIEICRTIQRALPHTLRQINHSNFVMGNNFRIPPQYLSIASLGFVAGWTSRGGKLIRASVNVLRQMYCIRSCSSALTYMHLYYSVLRLQLLLWEGRSP